MINIQQLKNYVMMEITLFKMVVSNVNINVKMNVQIVIMVNVKNAFNLTIMISRNKDV